MNTTYLLTRLAGLDNLLDERSMGSYTNLQSKDVIP